MLSGDTIDVRDYKGEPIPDDTFLLLFNAYHEPVDFTLPGLADVRWELMLDTREEDGFLEKTFVCTAGADVSVEGRSVCLLKLSVGTGADARTESYKKRRRGPRRDRRLPPSSRSNRRKSPVKNELLPQGADLCEGGVRYRVWAPEHASVSVEVRDAETGAERAVPLELGCGGLPPRARPGGARRRSL